MKIRLVPLVGKFSRGTFCPRSGVEVIIWRVLVGFGFWPFSGPRVPTFFYGTWKRDGRYAFAGQFRAWRIFIGGGLRRSTKPTPRFVQFWQLWRARLDSERTPPEYRHNPERVTARAAWAASKEVRP